MQKVIRYYNPGYSEVADLNNKYLDNGWKIIKTIKLKNCLYFIIEKETRKEKLEYIDAKIN